MISKPKNLVSVSVKLALIASIGAGAALYGLAGVSSFAPGWVGVQTQTIGNTRGVIMDLTYGAGTYWIEPFTNDIDKYDARLKKKVMDNVPSATKDGQPVQSDITFETGLIRNGVPGLHKDVGKNWYEEVVLPAARAMIRTATASVDSDAIYTGEGRQEVAEILNTLLKGKFEVKGIRILANVRDIRFTKAEFINLLEEKANAAQKVIIEERNALAAVQIAKKVANTAEGIKQKTIKEAEAEAAKVTLASEAEKIRLTNIGAGSRLQKEEEAKGLLAMKTAEAEGRQLLADALGGEGGGRIVEIEWAQNMGPNVKVYGIPTGAPGTNSIMDLNGMLKGAFPGNPK